MFYQVIIRCSRIAEKTALIVLFTILFFGSVAFAQLRISGVGAHTGVSSIVSMTTGLYGSIHLDTEWDSAEDTPLRIFMLYTRDIGILVDADRHNRRYPYMFAPGMTVHFRKSISSQLLLEFGAGAAFVQDGVFRDFMTLLDEGNTEWRSAMVINGHALFEVERFNHGIVYAVIGFERLTCIPLGFPSYTAVFLGAKYIWR